MIFRLSDVLSKDQIAQIQDETGYKKSQLSRLVRLAQKRGITGDHFFNNQLYKIPEEQLIDYLKKPSPRKYVGALSGRQGLNDFEIYQQIMRAKNEFGIPYSDFAKLKLMNASDEELESRQAIRNKKTERMINEIAEQLSVPVEEAQAIVNRINEKFGYETKEIYIARLYSMTDDEIEDHKKKNSEQQTEILNKIKDEKGWSKSQTRTHMSHCRIDFGIDRSIYYCMRCFELDDPELALCGNMTDSKRLSSRRNGEYSKILLDKQLFNETYDKYIGRKFWVNRDTSFDEFKEFADGLDVVFCKPIDSSIGRGTYKYDLSNKDLKESYDYFMEQPKYLVEECVTQHPKMAEFYPDSLNTVRLFTILDDGKFDAFASFVRFGVEGVIDNFSSGGIACVVDPKTGVIASHAVNKDGDIFETHPLSGIKFKGFQIPHWDKVLERSERALREVDGINYVGWDIAIQDDDIVFIEGNSTPDLGVQQALARTEGQFIRSDYYKYLKKCPYDDMLQKVSDNMRLTGVPEIQIENRLKEAAASGLDYVLVESEELCRLTVPQIKRYATKRQIRRLVNKVAKKNGVPAAEAFLQMRHAEKDFGISFSAFAKSGLFGSSDEELEHFAKEQTVVLDSE